MSISKNVLKTSKTISDSLDNSQETSLGLNNITYEQLLPIVPAMEYIANNKSSQLDSLYECNKVSDLLRFLITANYLNIEKLEKHLIKDIAQRCYATIENDAHLEKRLLVIQKCLNKIGTASLYQNILSATLKISPTIREQPITQNDRERIKPISTNKAQKQSLSPCKKARYDENSHSLTICSSNTQINLPKKNVLCFFRSYCLFAHADKFLLYVYTIDNDNTNTIYYSSLMNLAQPTTELLFEISSWNIKNKTKQIPLFNSDATLLLIDSYDSIKELDNTKKPNQKIYNIIDTSTGKCIKKINHNDNIENIFFYLPTKLFLHKKGPDDKSYSIELIDTMTGNAKIFDNIQAYKFNKKNTIVWTSHDELHNQESNLITIYDTNTDTFKKIKLDTPLTQISFAFNKTNDNFLIKGQTSNDLNKLIVCYPQSKEGKFEFFGPVDHTIKSIKWSATGNYIVACGRCAYLTENTSTIFNIIDKSSQTIKSNYHYVFLHPLYDVAYFSYREGQMLDIYNMSSKKTVSFDNISSYGEDYSGRIRKPTNYLIYDAKLLYFKSFQSKIQILNAITGKIVHTITDTNVDDINCEKDNIILFKNDHTLYKKLKITYCKNQYNKKKNKDVHIFHAPHRWIVEQVFGILSWFRGLKFCWSKTIEERFALLQLACSYRISSKNK